MIEGPCTDSTTVYTVLKNAQMVSDVLEQHDAVITFDVAFYIQTEQIETNFREVFSNNVACLEGFHIAMNGLSLLGKKLRFCIGLRKYYSLLSNDFYYTIYC